MIKFKYNKSNPITSYLVKMMFKRRPDDSMYALAKRLGANSGTLLNTFTAKTAWQQCILLFQICADLGITLEEALTQQPFSYHVNQEIASWREKYYEGEKTIREQQKEIKRLNKIVSEIKSVVK